MYTLSLHDALPISILKRRGCLTVPRLTLMSLIKMMRVMVSVAAISKTFGLDRKSGSAGMPRPISYAVFCLKKKRNLDERSGTLDLTPPKLVELDCRPVG